MKYRIIFSGLIILAVLITITLVAYPRTPRIRAQDDLLTDLNNRLKQAGVPVKSITMSDPSSFSPEITIQRIKNNDEWSAEDLWIEHLTMREAEISYKFGHRLDGFTLIRLAPDGEKIDEGKTFLYPGFLSQKPYSFISPRADDPATQKALEERLELFGLHLDNINVKTGVGSSEDVQLVEITLSTSDLALANEVLRRLVESFRPMINQLNQEPGSRIGLLRVHMVDGEGRPLLEYLWDVELDIVRGGTANGLEPWYSPPPFSAEDPNAGPTTAPAGLDTTTYPPPYPPPGETTPYP